MRKIAATASLRSLGLALISAIPPWNVILFLIHYLGGSEGNFRGFCLAFCTMIALTNRSNVWVTPITAYANPNYKLEN